MIDWYERPITHHQAFNWCATVRRGVARLLSILEGKWETKSARFTKSGAAQPKARIKKNRRRFVGDCFKIASGLGNDDPLRAGWLCAALLQQINDGPKKSSFFGRSKPMPRIRWEGGGQVVPHLARPPSYLCPHQTDMEETSVLGVKKRRLALIEEYFDLKMGTLENGKNIFAFFAKKNTEEKEKTRSRQAKSKDFFLPFEPERNHIILGFGQWQNNDHFENKQRQKNDDFFRNKNK